MAFDLPQRRLEVVHSSAAEELVALLQPLGLGARLGESAEVTDVAPGPTADSREIASREAATLRLLLLINAVMFAVELAAGWIAESAGLIADSLDMFADAAVYGLSLYAVGRPLARQTRAAHVSGWLQISLAAGAFTDVVRRYWFGSAPEPPVMIGVALLALAANVTCLALLARHRHAGAHMRASWIFSTNDVLANLGVIVAAGLVGWLGTPLPDLVIGCLIAGVVLVGGLRILRLR